MKKWFELTEEQKERKRQHTRKWRETHKEKVALGQKRYREKLKVEVLTYYGNGKLVCIQCGISDIRALCLDHIDGGANKARKMRLIQKGIRFYAFLKNSGFPDGYQTLCFNCNQIKALEKEFVIS